MSNLIYFFIKSKNILKERSLTYLSKNTSSRSWYPMKSAIGEFKKIKAAIIDYYKHHNQTPPNLDYDITIGDKLQTNAIELPTEDDDTNTPYWNITELLEGTIFHDKCIELENNIGEAQAAFNGFVKEAIEKLGGTTYEH